MPVQSAAVLLPFSDFHRSLRVLEDRRHVPGPQMQGALASPNLVTFQRTKSVQTETFQGEQGRQGRAASTTGGKRDRRSEEKDTHGLVRPRRIGGVELKRVRALVLPG